MPELPKISGNQAIKIFARLGFRIARQRGSHVVLRKGNHGCVIPIHKELAVGTLRSAIKQSGITVEEFIGTYKKQR
ncbi:MAG: type II toxin-antitoxin system HicA family toxin [Candidatus Aminicenantes bacterium]|nr:type II toxin-antitoxin system HicA family toxin [Candidatus Aminicenantes bacterium]